mmetsp:Transcript_23497/g.49703  ORF Transcript_23497/g.49703 Transcript_23497/m.49703 type:complete len:269 (+) Transcript_23497:1304-2110(+)
MKLVSIVALSGIASSVAFTGVAPSSRTSRVAALNGQRGDDNGMQTRRETLQSWLVGAAAVGFIASPEQALAFPNKISNQYDDRPKQRGGKPKALGVATRKDMVGEEYLGLKPCDSYKPNCFCSTDSIEDSPDSSIPPFKWPADKLTSQEDAFQQLYEVVNAYEPGQSNIDGGGFDIVTFDPKAGYIYAQFESLKNGYIDDLELAVVGSEKDNNAVQLRSSSRLGFLDFGVNAKRINYLANALRAKGWDAPGVGYSTHRGYADQNGAKW